MAEILSRIFISLIVFIKTRSLAVINDFYVNKRLFGEFYFRSFLEIHMWFSLFFQIHERRR